MWFNSSKKEGKSSHFSTAAALFLPPPLKVFPASVHSPLLVINEKHGEDGKMVEAENFLRLLIFNCTTCCCFTRLVPHRLFLYHAPNNKNSTLSWQAMGFPFFFPSSPPCIWRRFIVLCQRWWSIIHVGGSIWRTKSSAPSDRWASVLPAHTVRLQLIKKVSENVSAINFEVEVGPGQLMRNRLLMRQRWSLRNSFA